MRLIEIYRLNEWLFDLDKLESTLDKLDKLLSDEKIKILPLLVNPPMFPGEEEWSFYEQYIQSIMDKNGWKLYDEHLPVFNKKNWKQKPSKDFDGQPLGSIEDAYSMVVPVSNEAREMKSGENLTKGSLMKLNRLAVSILPNVREIDAEFQEMGVPLLINIPGAEQDPERRMSKGFKSVWDKKFPNGVPDDENNED